MAEFKISRIRYTWKNGWNTSTAYNKDDVVRYGGNTWVCVRQHTSSAFKSDQEFLANVSDTDFTPAWIKMTDGYDYKGTWTQSTIYALNDIVAYGGRLYLCIDQHTSGSTFAENSSDWEVYFVNQKYQDYWVQTTRYGVGDVVRYGGNVYECLTEHTSGTTADGLEGDIINWKVIYSGEEYLSEYQSGIKYEIDELVKYGGSILRVIEGHTSTDPIDNSKFTTEIYGFNFYSDWDTSIYYAEGDVVQHGGYLYRANSNNNGVNPASSIYPDPTDSTWTLILKATAWRGDWSSNNTYKTGDMVRRGGHLYIALVDTTLSDDGSTLDYLDSSNWELVAPAQKWNSSWTLGSTYELGDIVSYIGSVYECNFQHTSTNDNFPGDNGSGFDYWTLVLKAGDNVALTTRGDILTYGLSRANVGDGSTLGPVAQAIGDQDELLMVSSEGTTTYSKFGEIVKFRYVNSTVGVDDEDDPTRGISPFKPWKTVKFACEQIEDLGDDSVLHKIKVDTGVYEEILPIVVPAGTAVQGDELRSTTIVPKPADPALAGDRPYHVVAIDRISDVIQNVLALSEIVPETGNTVSQVLSISGLENISATPPNIPLNPDGSVGDEIYLTPSEYTNASAVTIQGLIQNIISYINFYIDSSGTEPTLTGSQNYQGTPIVNNVVKILTANKNFLIAEAVNAVKNFDSAYSFNQADLERRIRKYINAFIYDLRYIGNYRTLREAESYKNEVLGSETQDMFYVRNSTGIRDLSVKNLNGTLNPANVFELYRRPTGGAYVSLDPGWGPDDIRVWITTRSPYIQNVTTIGDNCVGQKIDGALHHGGNKSIVSNDFTQVLSDGIGAWVLNNGRAELVSVFTYYCQIGMFAENGGIIRATNGNSSYGDFGAISDGNDPTETPTFAEVDNRSSEATVVSAFAGEVNDEILILEYGNAGENYSTATYSFTGAGVNASVVHEEIRDSAIFEGLLKNAPGDSGGTIGGLGYINQGNNAQVGNTTSLTLATNDNNDEEDLLGSRLIITSGKGAGQYGYVTAYDPISKICNVSRESDDTPGWDHVIPGTPIQPSLFTDNTYRFEPRPKFSDPGFTTSIVNVGQSEAWVNAAYSETWERYLQVTGEAGTGETIGITPLVANFNIIKNSRKYEVLIDSGGAGYAVGDVITIKGSEIGGVDDEHDCIITVETVSDDSTNSILSVSHVGTAQSGRYVVVAEGTNNFSHSVDGTAFTLAQLPSTGNWKAIAAGGSSQSTGGRFVACKRGTDSAIYSRNGIEWSQSLLPISGNWESIVYGKSTNNTDVFLAIASDADKAVYTTDAGVNWFQTTLPDIGDSTFNQWVDVAYGKHKFVAVANSGNFVAVGEYNSNTDTWTWEAHIMDVIDDSSVKDWKSITYGNNRWVAVSGTGEVAYSFDANDWLPATMPTQDGSTAHNWNMIRYGQGVFFAIGDTGSRDVAADATTGPTDYAATSYDGVLWTERNLSQLANWSAVAFGNPDITLGDSTTQSNSTPMWITVARNLDHASQIKTGARALGRCIVEGGSVDSIRLWEPGSGYETEPTLEIFDPKNTANAYVEIRRGDAVLAQPGWLNRGNGYRTSSTQVTLFGDGFADVIPSDQFVSLDFLDVLPGPGTQFRFRGETEFYTVQTIESITEKSEGQYKGRFRVTPRLTVDYFLEHTSQVEVRQRYSQVRITGHDFLDVGTGNFTQTNYPNIYTSAEDVVYAPENEVLEFNGGRVFYTSTDQAGNFRCGELFAVEQATGIVTISADFFDLQGLTELALGGVRLGGSGTVVREFSTDPLFTQDSNNVVPTQRAIKAYLQNRLNVGGSDLLTASFIAGTVRVGPNLFGNVAGLEIVFPTKVEFSGDQAQISGSMLAQTIFFRSFDQGV